MFIDVKRVEIAHEFVLDSISRCDYSQGRRIHGLSLAVSGEAEYRFTDGKRYTVKAGDVVYLSDKTAYSIYINGEYRHFTVNFELDAASDLKEFDPITVFHTKSFKHMKNVFRELAETWKNKRTGYEMRAVAYVYELFSELIAEKSLEKLNKNGCARVLPAKEYIDSNCEKTMSISFLASLCKMSETNFRRAFLSAIGETPMRYRDKVLIGLAKDYLLSGFYTVAETAEKCGFDDPSYFGRFFKKHTGVSPGKFMYK